MARGAAKSVVWATLWLGGVVFPVTAGERATTESRRVRDAEASLRAAHFFTAGRGLHSGSNFRQTLDWLRDTPGNPVEVLQGQMGFVTEGNDPLGLFWVRSGNAEIAAVGCVACHAGRAAGRTYVGLGNKTFDVGESGRLVLAQSRVAGFFVASEDERRLNDDAALFGAKLSDRRWTNQTRGMVPTALIFRWFYEQSGESFPDDYPRGCVKVPHLWGYGEKRHVGQFVDGFADGDSVGWSALVDLAGGQAWDNYPTFRDRLRSLKDDFAGLLPPTYPFDVDDGGAVRGEAIFGQHCSRCHGEYRRDSAGRPVYEAPNFVPWEEVGTDDDRLKYRATAVVRLIDGGAWRDDFRHHDRPLGYFAPRLEGVWARFPYFHNGSVPTLAAVLTPAIERPRYWSLLDAGEAERFDAAAVGLTLPRAGSAEEKKLGSEAAAGSRDVYFVDRLGHANRGHEFGTELSDAEKSALIEYLKTL